jgi:phytoene dehydrogenase-like protein
MYDVAIIGAGIAGMATAARLQARGLQTVVLEAHGQVGGCAGFFRRKDFAFDVVATTLVDFEPGGVGYELLADIGMGPIEGEALPGYQAWLPDRVVKLFRDRTCWEVERLRTLGDSSAHRQFWRQMDRLAAVFWEASRTGVKLPVQNAADAWRALRCLGWRNLPLTRFLHWTVGDALRACGLCNDEPLTGLLSMLLEDTVHASIDDAPLINGALGITIRGAGLTRCTGGMFGFWKRFVAHYRSLGGVLRVGCPVSKVLAVEHQIKYRLLTSRGDFLARQVVSALPIVVTARLAPLAVSKAVQPYIGRDQDAHGGAGIVFLGVPEDEVAGQSFTHHQLLHAYGSQLGNGNNMFISVSAPGDTMSAPPGHRAVIISTHCALDEWKGLGAEDYAARKAWMGERLLELARRV